MFSLWIIALILLVLSLYKLYKYCVYRPPNFPPGPPRIPIFGSYLFLLLIDHKYLHKAVTKLCEYYKTNILGFYFGEFPIVIANDQASIKEMLSKPEFDGRSDTIVTRLRDPDFEIGGIFFTEGELWKNQRRFSLRYLRDFGHGRRDLDYEMEVNDEIGKLIEMIKGGPKYPHENEILKNDGVCLFPYVLTSCVNNCFLQILCGERIPRAHQYKNLKAAHAAIEFNTLLNEYGNLLVCYPWIRHVDFFDISNYRKMREKSLDLFEFTEEIVAKFVKTHEEGQTRNFLDVYLNEMKELERNGEADEFTYKQLIFVALDYIFPTFTSLATTIAALFQVLLHHPNIMEKVQKEIDDVVGFGRLPCLDDRNEMPYCEATLREIMRYETLVHSSISHKSIEEGELMGYTIPKDTFLYPGLHAINHQKSLWKDPENFRPERFLDEAGNLSLRNDPSLPFSGGKRLCAGETFSRNTMFLCYTAILQNFNIQTPDGSLPDLTKRNVGLTTAPADFWLKLEPK